VAGLVLSTILLPQGMAYAELAGLPPVTGLYTSIACLVTYALVGPSRVLVMGPDSAVSPLIFAAIAALVVASDDPTTAIAMAGLMSILVGVIQIFLGLAKLGLVADLLSKEVQVGFMNGLAITIVVSQLPKLCGFSTDAEGFVSETRQFFSGLDDRNWTAVAVGAVTLALLLVLPRVTRRLPAILVAVVGATVVTALFDLDLQAVGALPDGLPRPSIPWIELGDVVPLLIAAAGVALVSITDTVATSASFNARRGDEVDTNQELIGVGAANIASGLFQGFAGSASASRTAVAERAGARTQLTGLIGAATVGLLLVVSPSLLADLPHSALAAVIIAAAISFADLPALARFWRVRRTSLVLSLITTAGVVFFGVLEGIVAAVALSILLFFQRSWWPRGELLARFADGWHGPRGSDVGEAPPPEVIVFRWDAPLFFANSGIFRQQIRHHVRKLRPQWILLQCEAITDIDVTAAEMIERLDIELHEQGINLGFVELRIRLHDLLWEYGLLPPLDREHFYPSIEDALVAIGARGLTAV
jgi:high affinity sulfate transporter 1